MGDDMDVVYIVKEYYEESEELKYSLRSLVNFPHDRVWIFGGCPEDIVPDRFVPLMQKGVTNWQRVIWSIEQVCKEPDVSDDFWLFNDDFFVMKPVKEWTPKFDKTLYRRVQQIRRKMGGCDSYYSSQLDFTREFLNGERLKTRNYAVHMPMLINKRKALEVVRKYPRVYMFRALYGNYWEVGGEQMKDVKITDVNEVPDKDAVMLSTSDRSFREGKVGEVIREAFPDKCEFEI